MSAAPGPGPVADDLRAIRAGRVFVAGDVLLDVHVAGSAERVSPEAPVPVVLERSRRTTLGGAANVAAAVAAMGVAVELAGRVGTDAEGDALACLCEEAGIATALRRSPEVPTTVKTRIVAGYQQLLRVDREEVMPVTPEDEAAIAEALARFLAAGAGRCLILSDYAKGVLTPRLVGRLIAAARDAGAPVVVDPKAPTFERYDGATVIKPNAAEGRQALLRAEPVPLPRSREEEDAAIAEAVLAESGARNVVLSLSERGLFAAGEDAGTERRASRALSVADVSGAGDAMVAFLGMGCAAGLSLSRTLSLANAAAGVVCEQLGTVTVSPGALMAAMSRSPESPATQKMLSSVDHVSWLSSQLRRDGRRIGFANGCFDLLHAGHVALLQRARTMADVLVVGLNSDASVTRLKGKGRPVQPAPDRAAVLAGLACVDFVALFEEDTPLELILALRPDVIVKGGDYAAEDVVGFAESATWGGRVEIVPLVEGLSTTRLLEAGARP